MFYISSGPAVRISPLRLLRAHLSLRVDHMTIAHHSFISQLPIYPTPNPPILLADSPSSLEQEIGVARRTVVGAYDDAYSRVQGVISRWIGVEKAVESAFLPLH